MLIMALKDLFVKAPALNQLLVVGHLCRAALKRDLNIHMTLTPLIFQKSLLPSVAAQAVTQL